MNLWSELRAGAVLFEDDAALVLNKPAGVSVMGERHGTDLVRLAEEAGEPVFPVHRIDKNTSGAILFAKELRHHGDLTRQFNRRTVEKVYLAVITADADAAPLPLVGVIDLPLSVGRKNRVRVAGNRADIGYDAAGRWSLTAGSEFGHVKTYPSQSRFTTVAAGPDAVTTDSGTGAADPAHRLLAVAPLTGRRHQIRVHLAWVGHPILGDPLFDRAVAANGLRTYLHAWRLGFDTADGKRVDVTATPDADFWQPLPGGAPAAAELDQAHQRLRPAG
ncbi:RluA family pseudouridine synthase [Micromonospora sp. NBC_01813]|uniref:RluA family pseudouridine synthase n=1 Tax=Micromonospora sp. NBC_01813 TaxID=2975988 RepID=UPI002DD96653|nr:RluA family pseudouridine synthase [Micromonospora sp. NBC_01813]WSA11108.1 RluA family pseudouridine synthase [Micromonospora sp. NBC_01813]